MELVFLVGFFLLFQVVLLNRKHLLITLLGLELIVLVLIGGCVVVMRGVGVQVDCLIYLVVTVSVCEARIGLRLLVSIMRVHGSVAVKSLVVR